MSRVATENNFLYQEPSRIPRRTLAMNTHNSVDMENRPPRKKVSRLLQMQADYQERLIKEREDKLVHMYESNQRRALQRVSQSPANHGMVREFFQQRRMMTANADNTSIPPIDQHFQQMKNGQKYGYGNKTQLSHSAGSSQQIKKNSTGIDRSNPLAPIERKVLPPVHQKPQFVRSRNSRQSTRAGSTGMASSTPNYRSSGNYDTPPPNLSHLKIVQNQRIKQHSDFTDRKSQTNQDKERGNRLRNYRQNGMTKSKDEDDVDTELQKKQKELTTRITAQQMELEQLRKARLKEDMEEKKEMERRRLQEEKRRKKKREEEEDEKRRHLEEDEERKCKMKKEEQQQRHRRLHEEKDRQEREEEFQHKLQEEQRRSRNNNSYNYDQEDDFNTEEYTYINPTPTPPPPHKPQIKRATAPVKCTPPSQSTTDTEIYDAAIRLEGAYQNSNVKLVPCSNCARKFASDRIKKHELACPNLFKKRKVLDTSKLRTAGTEMENYAAKASKRKTSPSKKSNWRAKHESFIQSIRYAKTVTKLEREGAAIADLPPPPRSDTSDLTPCPHCGRKFNVTAAERHIPRCKNLGTRPVAVNKR